MVNFFRYIRQNSPTFSELILCMNIPFIYKNKKFHNDQIFKPVTGDVVRNVIEKRKNLSRAQRKSICRFSLETRHCNQCYHLSYYREGTFH